MGCILGCLAIQYENMKNENKIDEPTTIILKSHGECPICFENMYDNLMALPCSHLYHEKCVNKWFQFRHSCPMCLTCF